jgi:probable rRNA maturation factor
MGSKRRRDFEVAVAQEAGPPLEAQAVDRLREAVEQVLEEAGALAARISVALVDDATIHRLNREFLSHDFPTDVITFPLSDEGSATLEGEIVVSVETAAATAERLGWPAGDELLLYVVHGALHLVGYDDQDPDSLAAMRAAERRRLAGFGLTPPQA